MIFPRFGILPNGGQVNRCRPAVRADGLLAERARHLYGLGRCWHILLPLLARIAVHDRAVRLNAHSRVPFDIKLGAVRQLYIFRKHAVHFECRKQPVDSGCAVQGVFGGCRMDIKPSGGDERVAVHHEERRSQLKVESGSIRQIPGDIIGNIRIGKRRFAAVYGSVSCPNIVECNARTIRRDTYPPGGMIRRTPGYACSQPAGKHGQRLIAEKIKIDSAAGKRGLPFPVGRRFRFSRRTNGLS